MRGRAISKPPSTIAIITLLIESPYHGSLRFPQGDSSVCTLFSLITISQGSRKQTEDCLAGITCHRAENNRDENRGKIMDIQQYVRLGLLVAVAIVLHVVEAMLPIPTPVPGAKLGLANM
ncbi:MAG: Gx transporter family protein, partial [Limnochordia bacterium]